MLSTELTSFVENLRLDSSESVAFDIGVSGDDFSADFHCVHARGKHVLYLEPVLQLGKSVSTHSRACAQLASALCQLASDLECTTVHLCIRKGQRGYAAWMRACLYVGFTLTPKAKARRVVRSGASMVVLTLANDEKDGAESDHSLSTTDESDYAMSPAPSSPSLSLASPRSSGLLLDLAA